MIQDLSPSTITISPASIPPGNSQPESQTKNQPAKNQPGTEVLPEEKAREINQAITNLRTGARSAARIMAKLIGKDTGRAWIIENALKQPYSLETLQTAGSSPHPGPGRNRVEKGEKGATSGESSRPVAHRMEQEQKPPHSSTRQGDPLRIRTKTHPGVDGRTPRDRRGDQ